MHTENAKNIDGRPPHSKVGGGVVRPGEMVVMRLRECREQGCAQVVVRDRIREIMEHRKLKDNLIEVRVTSTGGTTRKNSDAKSSPFLTRYSSIHSHPESHDLFRKFS